MTTVEILKAARELISDEKRWTQGAYARDAAGKSVGIGHSPDAVCWCALGAIEKVTGRLAHQVVDFIWDKTQQWPAKVNDEQGHAAVLDLYDRAIILAEKEAANC